MDRPLDDDDAEITRLLASISDGPDDSEADPRVLPLLRAQSRPRRPHRTRPRPAAALR